MDGYKAIVLSTKFNCMSNALEIHFHCGRCDIISPEHLYFQYFHVLRNGDIVDTDSNLSCIDHNKHLIKITRSSYPLAIAKFENGLTSIPLWMNRSLSHALREKVLSDANSCPPISPMNEELVINCDFLSTPSSPQNAIKRAAPGVFAHNNRPVGEATSSPKRGYPYLELLNIIPHLGSVRKNNDAFYNSPLSEIPSKNEQLYFYACVWGIAANPITVNNSIIKKEVSFYNVILKDKSLENPSSIAPTEVSLQIWTIGPINKLPMLDIGDIIRVHRGRANLRKYTSPFGEDRIYLNILHIPDVTSVRAWRAFDALKMSVHITSKMEKIELLEHLKNMIMFATPGEDSTTIDEERDLHAIPSLAKWARNVLGVAGGSVMTTQMFSSLTSLKNIIQLQSGTSSTFSLSSNKYASEGAQNHYLQKGGGPVINELPSFDVLAVVVGFTSVKLGLGSFDGTRPIKELSKLRRPLISDGSMLSSPMILFSFEDTQEEKNIECLLGAKSVSLNADSSSSDNLNNFNTFRIQGLHKQNSDSAIDSGHNSNSPINLVRLVVGDILKINRIQRCSTFSNVRAGVLGSEPMFMRQRTVDGGWEDAEGLCISRKSRIVRVSPYVCRRAFLLREVVNAIALLGDFPVKIPKLESLKSVKVNETSEGQR